MVLSAAPAALQSCIPDQRLLQQGIEWLHDLDGCTESVQEHSAVQMKCWHLTDKRESAHARAEGGTCKDAADNGGLR